jgi:hypothetical protein
MSQRCRNAEHLTAQRRVQRRPQPVADDRLMQRRVALGERQSPAPAQPPPGSSRRHRRRDAGRRSPGARARAAATAGATPPRRPPHRAHTATAPRSPERSQRRRSNSHGRRPWRRVHTPSPAALPRPRDRSRSRPPQDPTLPWLACAPRSPEPTGTTGAPAARAGQARSRPHRSSLDHRRTRAGMEGARLELHSTGWSMHDPQNCRQEPGSTIRTRSWCETVDVICILEDGDALRTFIAGRDACSEAPGAWRFDLVSA